jgi:opacity protein-like surface antigen
MLRIGLVALAAAMATPAIAADADVVSVVKACVEVVHSQGYTGFDAFYNSADKTVQNNLISSFERGTLFIFQKCMSDHGFPLSSSPQTPPPQR